MTAENTGEAGVGVRRHRPWWHRSLEPEQRRRVMAELALTRHDAWTFRFVVMLTLSVVVAAMGLSADSAAVVIGAMLLAPLMIPVLGLAAAVSMGLTGRIVLSATRVAASTAWCILIAYLISYVLPDGPLPAEVVARTSPDLRDLVVALAAGMAGAYATVRADVSASLPGVAVAVALVPPLAAVGITLEAGRADLAGGALLLYGTNLAAIVLVGVVVFVTTGFVPLRRLVHATPGVMIGTAAAIAVVVAVAVPLMRASVAAARSAQQQSSVDRGVSQWLADRDDLTVRAVHVDQDRVVVEVSGPERPPDQEQLETILIGVLGPDVKASVSWTRTERVTTTTVPILTTTTVSPAEERRRLALEVVETWLTEASNGGSESYELDALAITADNRVRVDVVGVGDAPAVEELTERLAAILGDDLSVTLTWVPRSVILPTPSTSEPEDRVGTELLAVTTEFADSHGVDILGIDVTNRTIRIDLAGTEPPDTDDLEAAVMAILGSDNPPGIEIYFTPRTRIDGSSGG